MLVATFCLLLVGCAAAYTALIWPRFMLAMCGPSKPQLMPMILFSTQSVANVPPRPARIIQELMVMASLLRISHILYYLTGEKRMCMGFRMNRQ